MKKVLMFVSLFLSSCGNELCVGSDFYSEGGICVFTNGYEVEPKDVDYMIGLSEHEIIRAYPNTYNLNNITSNYDNTKITFIKRDDNNKYVGRTKFKNRRIGDDYYRVFVEYEFSKCVRFNILGHEMLHVFDMSAGTFDEDVPHPTRLFSPPDWAVEAEIERKSWGWYCPPKE